MPVRRSKKNKTAEERRANDFVIHSLKSKFLIIAKQEVIGKTPEITRELDDIVQLIREFEKENLENECQN